MVSGVGRSFVAQNASQSGYQHLPALSAGLVFVRAYCIWSHPSYEI